MEARVISWERVTELREEVGDDAFSAVVALFLEEVEAALARLKSAPGPDAFESDLHFVKGSAMTLGFEQLGELCQDGERRAAARQFAMIDIGAVVATYEASKDEFVSRLG